MDKLHGELSAVAPVAGELAATGTLEGSLTETNSVQGQISIPPVIGAAGDMFFHTTAEWNAMAGMIAQQGVLYVYTDHRTSSDGHYEAGFKVGDGTTYLIDLPFTDTTFEQHINNTQIHITQAEREFWNSKVRALEANEILNLTQL